MTEGVLERRRTPRVAMGPGVGLGVAMPMTVQLMDISASGVLISSPHKMTPGQRARLQLTLGGEAVSVEVEVRRVFDGLESLGRSRYRLGASFVAPDERARRSVEHFLRADGL
jgi:hypothetical protein